jgi:hypothetical protein
MINLLILSIIGVWIGHDFLAGKPPRCVNQSGRARVPTERITRENQTLEARNSFGLRE